MGGYIVRMLYITNCSICLNSILILQKRDQIPCGHMYHSECINKWFNKKKTCPMCRVRIRKRDMNTIHDFISCYLDGEEEYIYDE